MAILKATINFRVEGFKKLLQIFPDLNGSYLAFIGKRGREIMRDKFFSGQELDYSKKLKDGFPIDKRGRRTISSSVDKRRTKVTLSSYPADPFEHGRMLRSGRRETPKKIITVKLKREIATGIQKFGSQYENRFLKKALRGIDL